MNNILLASGGLDSTTLAYWLDQKKESFELLFINYGQHCVDTELETLKKVIPEHLRSSVKAIDVSEIYSGSKSRLIRETDLWSEPISYEEMYLPYRNILLLSIAAARIQAKGGGGTVYSGFINSNHALEIDCSANFFDSLEELMKNYGGVSICMPFRDMSKTEVAKIGIDLGVPIGLTYSCQVNSQIPCGACPNCVDRIDALNSL